MSFTHIYLGTISAVQKYVRFIGHGKVTIDETSFRKTGAEALTEIGGWPLVAFVNPNSFTTPED